MSVLKPDRYFERLSCIDVQHDLLDRGLKFVFLDIDNTIRSRATLSVPRDISTWMREAQQAGVVLCLLSNNFHDSALEFARRVQLPIVAKAMKPLPFGYAAALRRMGALTGNSVVVGDQISTDIVGAKMLGIQAFLVVPLTTTDLAHMRVIRRFEARALGSMKPEGGPQ